MMVPVRLSKGKGTIFTIVFICTVIYFISALLPSSSSSSKRSSTHRSPHWNEYSRIKKASQKQQLFYSALGHIRIGYVANRTPDVDTPPLLVMYSCISGQMPCGSWGKRLLDITNAYYFSMLVDGTAFSIDMTDPVHFQAYFESHPGFMSLQPSQAYHYIQQLEKSGDERKIYNATMETMAIDHNTNYVSHFRQKENPITILQTTQWPTNSITSVFQASTAMKPLRDKYRLNQLTDPSDWFWLAYRLLFNPTEWLASQLEPHRALMGGSVTWGDSLSLLDPRNQIDSVVGSTWFRIGLRLDDAFFKEGKVNTCLLDYIETLCANAKKNNNDRGHCHLFVSATSLSLLNQVRHHRWTFPSMTIHTIADSYPFTTIGQPLDTPAAKLKKHLFESDEQRSRLTFARSPMEWTILSRMDYLLGSDGDEFIKTAAWAAQVQTDLLTDSAQCQIKPTIDW